MKVSTEKQEDPRLNLSYFILQYFDSFHLISSHLISSHLRASAKILENPRTSTAEMDNPPPVAPATIAKEVKIPSRPPKITGCNSPPAL